MDSSCWLDRGDALRAKTASGRFSRRAKRLKSGSVASKIVRPASNKIAAVSAGTSAATICPVWTWMA
jgi:hypothetical protein